MSLHIRAYEQPEDAAHDLTHLVQIAHRSGSLQIFYPIMIVAPHAHFPQWLHLEMARQHHVVANIRMLYVEDALAEILAPKQNRKDIHLIHSSELQHLILALLTSSLIQEPEMKPFHVYLDTPSNPDRFLRASQLAMKLSQLFLEYEYQRPHMIDSWMHGIDSAIDSPQAAELPDFRKSLEALQRAQRYLYCKLFESDGYIQKCLPGRLTLPGLAERYLPRLSVEPLPLYFFGLPQISAWHMDLIKKIAEKRDIYFFITSPTRDITDGSSNNLTDLLQLWGKSITRSIRHFTGLIQHYETENHDTLISTTLKSLQHMIRNGTSSIHKLPQDSSLQIWSCPGLYREAETVYEHILEIIETNPEISLCDIAVLASDMERYQAPLQMVFEQHPHKIPYNLADANVMQSSFLVQGVQLIFDLFGSSFTRKQLFRLLKNPCCQAALHIDEAEVNQWLKWADTLGIFRTFRGETCGNNINDNVFQNPAKPFSWEFALERMRLGRIMTAYNRIPSEGDTPAFINRIPYADMFTEGSECLDHFSAFIAMLQKLLHPTMPDQSTTGDEAISGAPSERENHDIIELETIALSSDDDAEDETVLLKRKASVWSGILRDIFDHLLAIPFDRYAEAIPRNALYHGLALLEEMDDFFKNAGQETIPLSVARNFLIGRLQDLPARFGKPITDGVTICSLRRGRLLPFKYIFVMGLKEGDFPGEQDFSSLDLRLAVTQNNHNDLSAPEVNMGYFLDVLLSAIDALILTYPGKDTETCKEYHPCSTIYELINALNSEILTAPFIISETPLTGRSLEYLKEQPDNSHNHMTIRSKTHRLLCALHVLENAEAAPEAAMQRAREMVQDAHENWRQFIAPPPSESKKTPDIITLDFLADFLIDPSIAIIKGRYGINLNRLDMYEWGEAENEPFITVDDELHIIKSEVLRRMLRDPSRYASEESLKAEINRLFTDRKLRCRAPQSPFFEIDMNSKSKKMLEEIQPLAEKAKLIADVKRFTLLFGISNYTLTNGQEAIHLPSLRIPMPDGSIIRITGILENAVIDEENHLNIYVFSMAKTFSVRYGVPRYLIKPLIATIMLISLVEISSNVLHPSSVSLNLITQQQNREFPVNCRADEVKEYLSMLITEAYTSSPDEDIPYTSVMDSKIGIYPHLSTEYSVEEQEKYRESLTDLIQLRQDNPFDETSSRRHPILKIIGAAPPQDAFQKVARRVKPLCRFCGFLEEDK
jgi:exonuclease V gamma subunit